MEGSPRGARAYRNGTNFKTRTLNPEGMRHPTSPPAHISRLSPYFRILKTEECGTPPEFSTLPAPSKILDPSRELMPERKVRNGAHGDLHSEKEDRGKDSYAMNFPDRPEIEGDQENGNQIKDAEKDEITRKHKGEWPAGQSWAQECNGRKDHEPFMRGGIPPGEKSPRDEHRESGQLEDIVGK